MSYIYEPLYKRNIVHVYVIVTFSEFPINKQSCAERRKMKQRLLNLHFHRVMIRKPFFCFNLL